MTTYFQGDQPAEPVVVVPARDGDEVDLELYSSATAQLADASGADVDCAAAIVIPAEDDPDDVAHVAITLPVLAVPGLQLLTLQLHTASGAVDTFEVEPVVVQARDGWHTVQSAHAEWSGSAALDDPRLYVLLATARLECVAYAPKLPAGARPPLNYREAQLLHARNRNAAARIDPATGDGGTDDYSVGVFPLDWTVKQLLRPARRLGRVR
jgi:hypothetical protein